MTLLPLPTKSALLTAVLPKNVPLPLSRPAWRLEVPLKNAPLPLLLPLPPQGVA